MTTSIPSVDFDAVFNLLQEFVPSESIRSLQELVVKDNELEALKRARQYVQCYPALKAAQFIRLLLECQEALCAKTCKAKQDADRKLKRLEKDNKTEPVKILDARTLCDAIEQKVVWNNLELCRLRVLNNLYDAAESKAMEE